MKFQSKVTLVESLTSDPYYTVSYYTALGYWTTAKVFTFRHGEEGIWSQEKALADAIDLAKRLENAEEKTEVTIYQTPTDGNETEK